MFFKTHGQVLKKFEVEGLYSFYSIFVLRLQQKLQFFLINLCFSTRKKTTTRTLEIQETILDKTSVVPRPVSYL